MSDTVKLVIEIPKEIYNHTQEYEIGGFNQENDTKLFMAIKNGIPLDDVKAEIEQTAKDYDKFDDYRRIRGLWIALEILDNIGKESEE